MQKKWDTSWKRLLPDKQDLYLTLLWRDGYSEQAITDFFRTTKGRIVRRRHDLDLSSKGRGKIKGKVEYDHFLDLLDIHKMEIVEKETGVACITPVADQPEETVEETADEPDQSETMESLPQEATSLPKSKAYRPESGVPDEQRTASRKKPKYQIALDWRNQCAHRDEDRLQCSYVKESGSDYCILHK